MTKIDTIDIIFYHLRQILKCYHTLRCGKQHEYRKLKSLSNKKKIIHYLFNDYDLSSAGFRGLAN